MKSALKYFSLCAAFAFLCGAFSASAFGQKDTGTIVGTVRDPSGATVPGAQVTVYDVDRGSSFVTTTMMRVSTWRAH